APRFVDVGGLTLRRGAMEMVEAIGRIEKKWRAELDLAGEWRAEALGAQIRERAGWSRMRFHGRLDRRRVAELFENATAGLVVLHPTVNYLEAYPVKLFEYMAAGLPVIASNF